VGADGVHEDEGDARLGERALVAAGRLALAVVEVDELLLAQDLEIIAEARVELGKNVVALLQQLGGFGEGMERRAVVGIDAEVPGSQAPDAEAAAALLVQLAHEGDDVMLDGGVEAEAVVGGVVEALVVGEGVGAEIGEPGGERDFVAELEELIEDVFQFVGVLEAAGGDGFPGGFAAGAVGFLLQAGHAGEGLLLALELDRHGAADFLVLLGEPGDGGFARDVFLAVDLDLGLGAAAVDGVEGRELLELGQGAEFLEQRKLARLEPGVDDFDNVEVGLFARLVVGLAGHVDVGDGGRLAERGADFAVGGEPGFEFADGSDGGEGAFELVENGRELRDVGEVDGRGKKVAGREMLRLHRWTMPQKEGER
jgi:hypothetical protein